MKFRSRLALATPFAALALAGCGVNAIPTAEENTKAKWADVQNQYQRRADLIPNLVATVKGYATHEQSTLVGVTEARAKATQMTVSADDLTDPAKVKAFQDAQNSLSGALGKLLSVQEAYPQLQADQNFLALQSQLEGTENRIAVARSDYNAAVQAYNTQIRTFPDNITAKIVYGAKPITPFTATAPNAENAPTVKF
ncbi:LemA family protein [Sphingomonas abietis]|uniref:LemA family protein n=1 Tax=Sphingomonas abietis TaxID=3012344 RepID=A0ABY7NNB8_9SPHN|nr:LemA family protein [Sphingomonas abietis]WBO23021.1 LemA family protein [Sphingomonas abietis]